MTHRLTLTESIRRAQVLVWMVVVLFVAFAPGILAYLLAMYAHEIAGSDLGWYVRFAPEYAYWDIAKVTTAVWWFLCGVALLAAVKWGKKF